MGAVMSRVKVAEDQTISAGSVTAPLPQLEVKPTMPAGKRGPTGVGPRTNYSRVNTGAPPVPDAGASAQKTVSPFSGSKMAAAGEQMTMTRKEAGVLSGVGQKIKGLFGAASKGVTAEANAVRKTVPVASKATHSAPWQIPGRTTPSNPIRDHNQNAMHQGGKFQFTTKNASAQPVGRDEELMGTTAQRPRLQDMVKAAMAASLSRSDITREAQRQAENLGGEPHSEKQASAGRATVNNEYALKLASAIEFIAGEFGKEAAREGRSPDVPNEPPGVPRSGPVGTSGAIAEGLISEDMGEAITQPPMYPPTTNGDSALATDENNPPHFHDRQLIRNYPAIRPARGLVTTGRNIKQAFADHIHDITGKGGTTARPVAVGATQNGVPTPTYNRPQPGGIRGKTLVATTRGLTVSTGKNVVPAPTKAPHDPAPNKLAAGSLIDHFLRSTKVAEDRINPARISAGPAEAPGTSASGENGGYPAGGPPEGATNLLDTVEKAIDFRKREAYVDKKRDLQKYVDEPALSAATDKTLHNAFNMTDTAGAKIASDDGYDDGRREINDISGAGRNRSREFPLGTTREGSAHHDRRVEANGTGPVSTSVKTAAAKALLSRLAQESEDKNSTRPSAA